MIEYKTPDYPKKITAPKVSETLSSKIIPSKEISSGGVVYVKNIKEFIKELIEAIPYKKTTWARLMKLEIISRAGKELTRGGEDD